METILKRDTLDFFFIIIPSQTKVVTNPYSKAPQLSSTGRQPVANQSGQASRPTLHLPGTTSDFGGNVSENVSVNV